MDKFKNLTIYEFISTLSPQKKRIILQVILIVPILIVFITSWFVFISIEDTISNHKRQLENVQEIQAEIFTATIAETYKRSKLQTEYIRDDIVRDLNAYYQDDLDKMKKDYKEKNPSNPFYQILSENIKGKSLDSKSDNDRIFIANRDGILIDNSLTHYSNSFTTWDQYVVSRRYSQLLLNSIQKINSNENNMILWIDDRADIDIKENDSNLKIEDFIYKQVKDNKWNELKNFSVLVVNYIFEHNDIFGVNDVDAGVQNRNDKLYIIQIFNINDMMNSAGKMHQTIVKYQAMETVIQQEEHDVIKYKTIIFGLLVLLEIMCFFGVWYLIEMYFMFHPEDDIFPSYKEEE